MPMVIAEAPGAPVELAEIKALLRIAHSEEDALLAALMRAAADACEAFIGRALIVREVSETLPSGTTWTRLGASPVTAITGIATLAADGAAVALGGGDYAIDIDAAGEGWVRVLKAIGERRIRVTYAAGMAAGPNALPEALRHGIVRLAGHLYMQRDAGAAAAPPAAVTALWRPWRRLRLS